jgi:hypothetical protein
VDASHRKVIAICRNAECGERIVVSIGRFPGGENDRGGFVIACDGCGTKSFMAVLNPCDASRVVSGGKVVAVWDDDFENMHEVLAAHGLSLSDKLSESMLVIQSGQGDDDGMFDLADRAIYKCPACGDDLEGQAYEELTQALDDINRVLERHISVYLKGYETKPDTIRVNLETRCRCSTHEVSFFQDYVEADSFIDKASKFILAGPDDIAQMLDIDGIYSRDECIEIFKKLLLRWRARNQVVVLVVPFIGLDYRGREADRVDLWNLVLGHTDPRRTMLVTRRGTWNGFLKAAERTGLNIATLRKFGILAPMLEQFHSDDAFFKQQSHAKFYAAVGPKITEMLSGSFNIHSGGYAENLTFKTYEAADFMQRYLFPLGVTFDIRQIKAERQILKIRIQGGAVVSDVCEKAA